MLLTKDKESFYPGKLNKSENMTTFRESADLSKKKVESHMPISTDYLWIKCRLLGGDQYPKIRETASAAAGCTIKVGEPRTILQPLPFSVAVAAILHNISIG